MYVWSSSFFSVMKKRRKQHDVDHREDQVHYNRQNDDIHQVRCNDGYEDSPAVPPRLRLLADSGGEDVFAVIGNVAACVGNTAHADRRK